MGIYIKGMEMPKNCNKCLCLNRTVCGTIWESPTARWLDSENRPNWCPLVEVREPHGRLIDVDELIEDLKHDVAIAQDSLDYEELTEINKRLIQADKDVKQNAIDLLEHTRYIIEAEGAEE